MKANEKSSDFGVSQGDLRREAFSKWATPRSSRPPVNFQLYDLGGPAEYKNYYHLTNKGFMADRALEWGAEWFEREIAIISFVSPFDIDNFIANPPQGLKCVRLPQDFDDFYIAVASIITGPGPGADAFINHCHNLPVHMLPWVLPCPDMNKVVVDANTNPYYPNLTIDWHPNFFLPMEEEGEQA